MEAHKILLEWTFMLEWCVIITNKANWVSHMLCIWIHIITTFLYMYMLKVALIALVLKVFGAVYLQAASGTVLRYDADVGGVNAGPDEPG